MFSPHLRVLNLCAVMCMYTFNVNDLFSAVTLYHNNLCTPAIETNCQIEVQKVQKNPSIFNDWVMQRLGHSRLVVWQAAFQLINISAAHHHFVQLHCDEDQTIYVGGTRWEPSSWTAADTCISCIIEWNMISVASLFCWEKTLFLLRGLQSYSFFSGFMFQCFKGGHLF